MRTGAAPGRTVLTDGVAPARREQVDERIRAGSRTRSSPWIGGQNGSATDDGWRSMRTATHSRPAAASIASRNGPIASMS